MSKDDLPYTPYSMFILFFCWLLLLQAAAMAGDESGVVTEYILKVQSPSIKMFFYGSFSIYRHMCMPF
jgi:hypothetical protein